MSETNTVASASVDNAIYFLEEFSNWILVWSAVVTGSLRLNQFRKAGKVSTEVSIENKIKRTYLKLRSYFNIFNRKKCMKVENVFFWIIPWKTDIHRTQTGFNSTIFYLLDYSLFLGKHGWIFYVNTYMHSTKQNNGIHTYITF